MPRDPSFWEDPAQVQRFAALDPDDLLLRLLQEVRGSDPFRALDLGCAGGRNAEVLLCADCETWALDLSTAMCQATRDRLGAVASSTTARSMVTRGRFAPLPFASGSFDLVVAVGVYIQAVSDAELRVGLAETHRVLKGNGRVFVAQWSTQTLPAGALRVRDQRFIYACEPGERRCRLNQAELVDLMDKAGLSLVGPITRRRPIRDGRPHESLVGVFVKH
jgi:SAM-dependent methyltransferase